MIIRSFLALLLMLTSATVWADPIQDWIDLEQLRIDRTVDERKILAPDIKNQKAQYRPENQKWYPLKAIWVPKSELHVAFDELNLDPKLGSLLVREVKGKREFRLLIHPESEKFYGKLLKKYPADTETFRATSTASSRTVLVESNDGAQFFAKLSLDVELGGVTRTVPRGEVARSVGTSMYLSQKEAAVGRFGFLPEPLGISPEGWDRGGMIIRTIPLAVQKGKRKLVPLFSLYAKGDGGKTLLEEMIQREQMAPDAFVKKFILEPFFEGWADWNFNKLVTMEAHAQNVLLELDENNHPTGRFVHRDLGGFNIDFGKEKAAGYPTFSTFEEDYHQKFSIDARKQSIHTYFEGGFLFNINKELKRIQPGYKTGSIYEDSRKILAESIFEATGERITYADVGDAGKFAKAVNRISQGKAAAMADHLRATCSALFSKRRR